MLMRLILRLWNNSLDAPNANIESMTKTFKKIHVNQYEERTSELLNKQAREEDARVFSKVALKDVLPFEGTELSTELSNFCWVSHFDFVVTDSETLPLFVVEFDGPSHESAPQRERDRKKDELCRIFRMPILGINSRYLTPSYRGTELLSWFAELFFLQRAFADAEEKGCLLPEEGFDPMCVASIGDRHEWPLDLAHGVREEFRRLHEQGLICDDQPSYTIGRETSGTHRAFGFVALSADMGVFGKTAMRAQQFDIGQVEALEILINFEIFDALKKVLSGEERPEPLSVIMDRMEDCSRGLAFCREASMNSAWTTRSMFGGTSRRPTDTQK
jgi:hypothetical protein